MSIPKNTPQFFFDDSLIAHQERLVRRWLPATVFPRPVLEPDQPWEGRNVVLYGTVLPDPAGGWRMYYCNWPAGGIGRPLHRSMILMATSPDGLRWEKPALGLIDWNGSKANNIVLRPELELDAPSVIYDADDKATPWKLLVFHADESKTPWNPRWGLYLYKSRDGLTWEPVAGPRVQAGDNTNLLATKVNGRFVAYTRHPQMMAQVGARAIYRTESHDAMTWTEPDLVLAPDLDDEPDVEFYGMSVFERHGWHFGLLQHWQGDQDIIETRLTLSRDGKRWTRPLRHPFIAATYDWNRKWSTCASNGPILLRDQMLFYLGGRLTSHSYDYAQQYSSIGYASLPVDRFCALEGTTGGWFETVPIEWPGGELVINADTRESFSSHPMHLNGELTIELFHPDRKPLNNWSGENKAVFHGNTHARCILNDAPVKWPHDKKLDTLRNQSVRFRFHFKHARLFTIEARKT